MHRKYLVWANYGMDGWCIVFESDHWSEISTYLLSPASRGLGERGELLITENIPVEVVWKED